MAFFDAVVEALGVAAAEVLFIDDVAANVAAARTAGLQAERWHHDLGDLEELLAVHGH